MIVRKVLFIYLPIGWIRGVFITDPNVGCWPKLLNSTWVRNGVELLHDDSAQ